MRPLIVACLGSFFVTSLALATEPVKGAAVILEELQKKFPTPSGSASESFKKELTNYQNTVGQKSPSEAAEQWLGLTLKWTRSGLNREVDFKELVKVLPGPAAWPDLQKTISVSSFANPVFAQLMRLFSATLNNDDPSRWQALEALGEIVLRPTKSSFVMAPTATQGQEMLKAQWPEIAQAMMKLTDDPARLIQALEMQLASVEAPNYPRAIEFSNLAPMIGEEKLRALLTKALEAGRLLEVTGDKDREMARSLVLANLEKLKTPTWSLVSDISPSSLSLYKALAQKFSATNKKDSRESRGYNKYEQRRAAGFYLLSLIAAKQGEEAKAFILSENKNGETINLPYDAQDIANATGFGEFYYGFIHSLLESNPDLSYWNEYVSLAAARHETGKMLELAKKSATRQNLTATQRRRVLSILGAAYLAHGSVEEGVANLRELLVEVKAIPQENEGQIRERNENIYKLAMQLVDLGKVLKRNDWRDEGLQQALAVVNQSKDFSYSNSRLVALMNSDRASEAEKIINADLQRQLSKPDQGGTDLQEPLTRLADIYDQKENSSDVLLLLKTAPWWGKNDLAKLVDATGFRNVPLGLMAARALATSGDIPSAVAILKSTIHKKNNCDAAYEWLVKLEGDKALLFLEECFAQDAFEERPLIWKAVLQLAAHQIEPAEKTIRQAIAIDPSDGEMGKGDRMRAYAVLADVLEAEGKPNDAKIYRSAVAAIRISEDADDFKAAGLTSQAVAMYEDALKHFSDAYCIQSRLAIQLANLGEMEKAEEHYRRAYELMPDSFGRVESHCFGCERAFKGKTAETLAEKTFQKMLESHPEKPQLHYLLGYLRMEQERWPEALALYQKAVALDPDYLNAWKKIVSVSEHTALPIAQRDAAILNLLRLDPWDRHGREDPDSIADLPRLWEVKAQLQKLQKTPVADALYPLVASAQELTRTQAEKTRRGDYDSNESTSQQLLSPHEALANHRLIGIIADTLTQISQ